MDALEHFLHRTFVLKHELRREKIARLLKYSIGLARRWRRAT
jgi:hypothetical protein